MPPLSVIALCAQWCGACREFKPVFDALASSLPGVRFVWVDIEEEPEVTGEMEIETFPALGILRGDSAAHFGPSTPRRVALERLIRAIQRGESSAPVAAEAAAVLRRAVSRASGRLRAPPL